MNIFMCVWVNSGFRGLPYTHGQQIEGTEEDAFRIARECFSAGLNVMVTRTYTGTGSRRDPAVHSGFMVAVDDRQFQAR